MARTRQWELPPPPDESEGLGTLPQAPVRTLRPRSVLREDEAADEVRPLRPQVPVLGGALGNGRGPEPQVAHDPGLGGAAECPMACMGEDEVHSKQNMVMPCSMQHLTKRSFMGMLQKMIVSYSSPTC